MMTFAEASKSVDSTSVYSNVKVEKTKHEGAEYYLLSVNVSEKELTNNHKGIKDKLQGLLRVLKEKGLVVEQEKGELYIPAWATVPDRFSGTVVQRVSINEYEKYLHENVYEDVEFDIKSPSQKFDIKDPSLKFLSSRETECIINKLVVKEDLTRIKDWEEFRSKDRLLLVKGVLDNYINKLVVNLIEFLSKAVPLFPYVVHNEDEIVFVNGVEDPYDKVRDALQLYANHNPFLVSKMKSKILKDNFTKDLDLKGIHVFSDDLEDVTENLVYRLLNKLVYNINLHQTKFYDLLDSLLGVENRKYLTGKGYFKFHLQMGKSKYILDKFLDLKEHPFIGVNEGVKIKYKESVLELGKIFPLPEKGYTSLEEIEFSALAHCSYN